MTPRASIVTPSYNQAEYLEETINSVLSQEYPNLEYIIIDGGSTDGSVDIIKKYERFLRYWVSEPDEGQSHAINKGWQRATGDIIAYLNSDDLYLPGTIAASVEQLRKHPETDLIYGNATHIDTAGKLLHRARPGPFSLDRLLHSCFIPQPAVFMRRSLYERVGPLSQSINFTMDYEYWLRACLLTIPLWLNRFTAAMRYHPLSKSSSSLGSFLAEEMAFLEPLVREGYLDRVGPSVVRGAYLRRLVYLAGERSGCAPEERSGAVDRIRSINPPPTVRELTEIVARHDAFLSSAYVNPDADPAARVARQHVGDAAASISTLAAAGVVSQLEGNQVLRRVQACAWLAAALGPEREGRLRALYAAVVSMARYPDLILNRGLWARVIRAVSFAPTVVSLYDHGMNLARSTLRFLRRTESSGEATWR